MYHASYVHSTNLSKYSKKYIQPPSLLNLEKVKKLVQWYMQKGNCIGIISTIVNRIVSQSAKTS